MGQVWGSHLQTRSPEAAGAAVAVTHRAAWLSWGQGRHRLHSCADRGGSAPGTATLESLLTLLPPVPPAALCLVLGCMIFPDGWDAETIRDMCGEKTGKYSLGDCSVRWAYILAIIGILNALILSFLAFVLGNRQNDLLHEELKTESKGEHRATGGPRAPCCGPGRDPRWEKPGGLGPSNSLWLGKGPVGLTVPCKVHQARQGGGGLPGPCPA